MRRFLEPKTNYVLAKVEEYRLFDADWYAAAHPELGLTADNAYRHYRSRGARQGFSPTPLFQPETYLVRNPDVAKAGAPALFHYLRHGGREERPGAHFLIAPDWIAEQMDVDTVENANPLIALATAKAWIDPRPMIDTGYLARQIGAAAGTTWDALRLYAGRGAPDDLAPHLLFDPAEVRASSRVPAGESALEFYIRTQGMGIRPHALIDPDLVFASGEISTPLPEDTTVLEELIRLGRGYRGRVHALFDTEFYKSQAEADLSGEGLALEHFLRGGWEKGYWPNSLFDPIAYARRYLPQDSTQNPLVHYAKHGREPYVDLTPQFSQQYYTVRNPEVLESYSGTPLEHFFQFGRVENRVDKPTPVWRDNFSSWNDVQADIQAHFSGSPPASPSVSVIIPVFNEFHYTVRCVWSILRAGDAAGVEVIVADDGSDDETGDFFSNLPGLRYVRNPENLGFLRSCSRAADLARAPVLYFLNNDTAVLPGWCDALLETFSDHPEAGLVGSKLIYPDGRLQEAGGYIWRDGGGANTGRGGDPAEPGYNYLRDVDYVSGAAIAVRRAAWDAAGGFDDRYAPAYCEDSDLAMTLRLLGWRVLYQPCSEVVHFEGVSSGTSTTSGVKAYQVTNQAQLRDKWAYALEAHAADHLPDPRALWRPRRPRICVIDATVPTPDRDAGSVTALWYLKILIGLGYEIVYLPENLHLHGDYGRALQAIGVEVLHTPYVRSVEQYLRAHGETIDAFLLYRVDAGGRFFPLIRQLFPGTPVIFDTVDLHYLRLERQATLPGADPETGKKAEATKTRELRLIAQADATIVLSAREAEILEAEGLRAQVAVVPLVLAARPSAAVPPREGRSGIAFVGGYQHTPNVDAVLWFCETIWPALRAMMPDLTFHVVGSNPPAEVAGLDVEGVEVHGYVADLDGFLDARIATIAPLQYGAGIKGKIGSSMAAGVPCVATPVAAEGMGLTEGDNILVAETPQGFAEAVAGLCRDDAAWDRLSRGGLDFVEDSYSPAATRARLLRVLAQAGAAPFTGVCPITGGAETRRFLDGSSDSLAAAADAPWSSERVLATALIGASDPDAATLQDARMDGQGPIALVGRLPALGAALRDRGLTGAPADARRIAARIVLDDTAPAALDALLAAAGPRTRTLHIALVPADGQTPATPHDPAGIATLATRLQDAGWSARTTKTPTPETAITKTILLEARRQEPT